MGVYKIIIPFEGNFKFDQEEMIFTVAETLEERPNDYYIAHSSEFAFIFNREFDDRFLAFVWAKKLRDVISEKINESRPEDETINYKELRIR